MRKKIIYRDIITLLMSTLITMVTWVGFEIYRAYTRNEIPGGIEKYLENLDPTLDEKVFEELKNRGL